VADLLEPVTNSFFAVNDSHLELREAEVLEWTGPLPTFVQFPDQVRLDKARVAYGEIMLLARAALMGLCQRNRAFERYFQESEADNVRKVFAYILGNGWGPREVANPAWPLHVIYANAPPPGMAYNPCQNSIWTNLNAVTWNWRTDQKGIAILLCPRLFVEYPRTLLDWDCDHIPAYAIESIATRGSILLHEFVHLNVLTFPAAGIRVLDYGLDFWGKKIPKDGLPVDGYGPYNAWVLNNNANKADKQPSLNADSYMWFALESYWSQQCNGDFTDPRPDGASAPRADIITNIQDGPDSLPRPRPLDPQAPASVPAAPAPMDPNAAPFVPGDPPPR
jgi:hypothetical protein